MTPVSAIAGAIVLIGLTLSANAAPAPSALRVKLAEAAGIDNPASAAVDAGADSSSCSRARRRLWVEGEGWVVRRITTCR